MYTENQSQVGAYYPQIVEFEIYFWNESKLWTTNQDSVKTIRFKAIGQSFGKTRWRPHLVLYKDEIPPQTDKEYKIMLQKIREAISMKLNLACMLIAKDLLDSDIRREDY